MKPQRDVGLREFVRGMGSWGWYFRGPWAVVTIPVAFIAGVLVGLWGIASESLWFARGVLVLAIALLLVTGVALNAFEKPPTILLGYEECFDRDGRGERCREATALADIDIGNPRWVHWFQQNQEAALLGGFFMLAIGIVGTGRNGTRRNE